MKTLLSLFLISVALSALAQPNYNIDSLKNELNSPETHDTIKSLLYGDLFQATLYSDVAVAKKYAVDGLAHSSRANFPKGIALSSFQIGVHHSLYGSPDSTLHYYELAFDKFYEIGEIEMAARVKSNAAMVKNELGNPKDAIEMLNEVKVIHENITKDSISVGRVNYNLGFVNLYSGNYNIALVYLLEAEKIFREQKTEILLADAVNNLASVELSLENFEKSIEYNLEALEIYKKRNDRFFQTQAANDLGLAYFHLKEFKKSETYFNEALSLAREMEAADMEGTVLVNLAKSYRAEKKYEASLALLKEGLRLQEEKQNKRKIVEALNGFGATYNEWNKPAKALPYLNRAVEMADTIGDKQIQKITYFRICQIRKQVLKGRGR